MHSSKWTAPHLKIFLTAYKVPAVKLDYQAGPLPCWDTDRSQREPISEAIKRAVFRLDKISACC